MKSLCAGPGEGFPRGTEGQKGFVTEGEKVRKLRVCLKRRLLFDPVRLFQFPLLERVIPHLAMGKRNQKTKQKKTRGRY